MVEHNLAKVGVASSNLVSRSIFLLLLITTFSHAITLKQNYCIDEETSLDSRFFGVKKSFHVIDIPKIKTIHKVPSLFIKTTFEKHGIEVKDVKSGIITFKRNCDLFGKKEEISLKLMEIFEKKYPCIRFEDLPEITPTTTLPYDFKTYKLLRIKIKSILLRKSRGAFKAIFETPNGEKKVYFKFSLNAYINVFKAKHKLYNDKILSSKDVEMVEIFIDELPSRAITCNLPDKLITKNYISTNSILSMNKLKHKKDVLRGDRLRVYIKEGVLLIAIPATILKDANIGDIVKIKTEAGKVLKAKLVSKYKALVLE